MKPGAGKGKGSNFEREVCRALTKWITGKTHPEIFWRSASSGAKATQDIKAGRLTKMHADIKAIEPEGAWLTNYFCIECKNYNSFDWRALLFGAGELFKFFIKICNDSDACGKRPMLICKENRKNILILFDGTYNIETPVVSVDISTYEGSNIKVFDFTEFLLSTDPKAFQFFLDHAGEL